MHCLPKTRLKKLLAAALLPWLLACTALTPGMHIDPEDEARLSTSGAMPSIKSITPQLLQSEREQREQQTSQGISSLQVDSMTPYRIDRGDVLSIVVWDHPELANAARLNMQPSLGTADTDGASAAVPPAGFVVDHDGMVQFPYAGALNLSGLTEMQARDELTLKLARYIKKPDVTLRVQAYRSQRIYIGGEVKAPGTQVINDIPMTLTEALNRAGGVLPSGDQSRISISRAGINHWIDIPQLIKKGVDPSGILLAHGDVIHVLSRDESKVFVMGDVTRPMPLTMHDGRLTLNEALGEAGGINQLSADGRQVYVVRNEGGKEPSIYNLDARSPVALAMAESFELKPKDVVFVNASQLAMWNRVISLILPSTQSLTNTAQIAK